MTTMSEKENNDMVVNHHFIVMISRVSLIRLGLEIEQNVTKSVASRSVFLEDKNASEAAWNFHVRNTGAFTMYICRLGVT